MHMWTYAHQDPHMDMCMHTHVDVTQLQADGGG